MNENIIVELASKNNPLVLDCGKSLGPFKTAYTTYGTLNSDKSNAILVCHALTGDQYVASEHPITKKNGWWSLLIGSGKSIDTDKYFIICPNVIGGCMGSTGPNEVNPETGKEYGLSFPVITISDMVKAQKLLIDNLNITKLFSVVGGSMGGMLVLEWLSQFPDHIFSAIPIATTTSHSAQNIALNELARQAIMADPEWNKGDYANKKNFPRNFSLKGLKIVIDCANGAGYKSGPELLRSFGAQVISIGVNPNGLNINEKCGSTFPNKIKFIRANVGDRYVKEKMQKNNFNLGGEQSGHIILGKFATTGDGLLVALEVLFALRKGKKASNFFNVFKKTPQILENIIVKDKNIIKNIEVKKSIRIANNLMKGQGRMLVRKSGTEPKIRIMGESNNKKLLVKCIYIIKKTIK